MTTKSKSDSESALALPDEGYKKPKREQLPTSDEISDELYERSVRDEARQFMPSAIGRIAEIANSDDEPVALRASNSIIEHGRKNPKLDLENTHMHDGVIQINIINFEASEHGQAVAAAGIETSLVRPLPPSAGGDVIDIEPADDDADPLLVTIKDFSSVSS